VVLCGPHRTVLSDEVDIHLVEIRRSSLLRMTAVEVKESPTRPATPQRIFPPHLPAHPRLYAPHITTPLKHGKTFGVSRVSTLIRIRPSEQEQPCVSSTNLPHSRSKYQHTRFFGKFPKVDSVDLGGSKMANAEYIDYQSQDSSQVERQPPTSPASPSPGSPAVGL